MTAETGSNVRAADPDDLHEIVAMIHEHPASQGTAIIHRQTPDRNDSAIRFYDRPGASRAAKQRPTDHQIAHETR